MLDHMTVAHFEAFGFVVLRGLLTPAETDTLRKEAEFAVSNAYAADYTHSEIDTARQPAFDVPTMTTDTPLSMHLIADDSRLWQASHYLMRTPTIPSNAEATCFLANSRWHADLTPEVQGVKFMAYLQPCSGENGQLQVMPGSHQAATRDMMWEYIRQDPRRQGYLENPDDWQIPAVGIDAEPGDVIAFHVNLLHASIEGRRRMAWSIYYFADPALEGPDRYHSIRDAILHIGDYSSNNFDNTKWPVWRDWVDHAGRCDARATAISRLGRIGVLSTKGADVGTPEWDARMLNPSQTWSSGAPPRKRHRPT
jgi:hypothetical protein